MIILLLFLSACSSEPVISKANLTDKERSILNIGNHYAFAYDYKLSDEYEQIHLMIDRYEFGHKVGVISHNYSTKAQYDEGIIIAKVTDLNNGYFSWLLAIGNENNLSSAEFSQHIEAKEINSYGEEFWINENLKIEDNRVILGCVIYKFNDDSYNTPLSEGFYESVNNNIDEIKDYDLVYILRIALY